MTRSFDSLGRSLATHGRSYSIGPVGGVEMVDSFEYDQTEFENRYSGATTEYVISGLRAAEGGSSLDREWQSTGSAEIWADEAQYTVPRPGERWQYNSFIIEEDRGSVRPYWFFGVETPGTEFFSVRPNFGGARFALAHHGSSGMTLLASDDISDERLQLADDWIRVTVDWRRQDDNEIRAWMHRVRDEWLISHITTSHSLVQDYTVGTFGWNLWYDGTQSTYEIHTDALRKLP